MSIFRRLLIFQVGLRVYLSTKFVPFKIKYFRLNGTDAWLKLHTSNAKLIHKTMVSLEGSWIKAGQYLSSRSDVMPAPYIKYFSSLQDALTPKPFKDIK